MPSNAERREPDPVSSPRSTLVVLLAASAAFVAFNVLVFFTPLYRAALDPASSTGSFERSIRAFDAFRTDPRRDVLVLGDSRIYAALDPALADPPDRSLRFLNAGIPGTDPRCWFYYDRAIDPQANRFRAVVIPVDSYVDDTSAIGSLDADDHASDLRYVLYETRLGDLPALANSFGNPELRGKVLFDLLMRGPVLRPDIEALLRDPAGRVAAIRGSDPASYAPESWHPFVATLAGLHVDFSRDTIVYPTAVGSDERSELEKQVLRLPEPSASYAAYRTRWLGPIVERYRRAHVAVVFVRIPTRPVHRTPPPPPAGSLVALANDGGARLVPQAPYVALERPELFADHDHLDRAGSRLFSRRFGRDVAAAIAATPAPIAVRAPPPAPGTPALGAPLPARTSTAAPRPSRMRSALRALRIGIPIEFQSVEFLIFFGLVVALFYGLPRPLRSPLLFVSSYYFYARWNAVFVVILAAITLSDYVIARSIERFEGGRRRALTAVGVGLNLAFLGAFKYLDFATGSVAAILGRHPNPWYVNAIVPVGISFHTFQSISYLVDVARKRTRAIESLLDYAVYIAFFPQLLSGPIVRAERFFRELYEWGRPTAADVESGVLGIALGLTKKLAIADAFAPTVDAYFAAPGTHPGTAAAWGAAFAFAMQIYFDFSGYSDIAIGCARLLGFAFPANFDRPYFAQSITSFWRRWNMTLSSWLRDYLYVPLGGNRHGTLATYRNLLLTMLLAGLWHGAAWTFVAWGGYHGSLLAIERRFGLGTPAGGGLARTGRWLGTFVLVTLGWVLFRAASFGDAFTTLRAMVVPVAGLPPATAGWPVALSLIAVGAAAAEWHRRARPRGRVAAPVRALAFASVLVALELFSTTGDAVPFVYFKF